MNTQSPDTHKLPSNLELFIRAASCVAGVRLARGRRAQEEGAKDPSKRCVGEIGATSRF